MRIPCSDEIVLCDEMIDIRPIFNDWAVQRLGHIQQLGQTARVFLGGKHTRLEHSLGTFALAKKQCADWRRRGLITAEEARILCLFAFLHDIGHFPFSHAIEPLLDGGHHDNGINILFRMSKAIAQCGVDKAELENCLREKNPLAAAVHHGLLGWDKIDYLVRDAHHTGFGGSPETKLIMAHTLPCDGRIVVEKTALHEVLQLKNFMYSMYMRIYERSKVAYARRLMQKIYECLVAEGVFRSTILESLTDPEFEAQCMLSRDDDLRHLYDIHIGIGNLPQTGLLVCLKGLGSYYERSDKAMRAVVELDADAFLALSDKVTWKNAARLEANCAAVANCRSRDVFIQPSRNPRRSTMPATIVKDGDKFRDLAEIVPPDIDQDLAKRVQIIRVGTTDPRALETIFKRSAEIVKMLGE